MLQKKRQKRNRPKKEKKEPNKKRPTKYETTKLRQKKKKKTDRQRRRMNSRINHWSKRPTRRPVIPNNKQAKLPGLFTGHVPNPRVGSRGKFNRLGRVGSGQEIVNFLTDQVWSPLPDPTRPDLARFVPTHEQPRTLQRINSTITWLKKTADKPAEKTIGRNSPNCRKQNKESRLG